MSRPLSFWDCYTNHDILDSKKVLIENNAFHVFMIIICCNTLNDRNVKAVLIYSNSRLYQYTQMCLF